MQDPVDNRGKFLSSKARGGRLNLGGHYRSTARLNRTKHEDSSNTKKNRKATWKLTNEEGCLYQHAFYLDELPERKIPRNGRSGFGGGNQNEVDGMLEKNTNIEKVGAERWGRVVKEIPSLIRKDRTQKVGNTVKQSTARRRAKAQRATVRRARVR